MSDAIDRAMGTNPINITNTTPWTGDAWYFVALTAVTFDTFTELDADGAVATSVEYPAGTQFLNNSGITAVTLSGSGKLRGYAR